MKQAIQHQQDSNPWKVDFPALNKTVNGKYPVYLDTASSAQKPQMVIDAMRDVFENGYANVHRGVYSWSQETTRAFEDVRAKVANFIQGNSDEIVFTRNTTEAINLVAHSWGRDNLSEGDEVILSEMEHHANIVPWQLLRDKIGFEIKTIPIQADGTLDINAYKDLLSPRVKLVGVVDISNALGIINPVGQIVEIAKKYNKDIKVLVDGSQSVIHRLINIRALNCDFFTFTGHKLYGPTGVGVLWGRKELLECMSPYQGGGDMIETVSFEHTTFKDSPAKFEAGTPAIAEIIGLGAAIDYIESIGMENIIVHENALTEYCAQKLQNIEGLKLYGEGNRVGIFSFKLEGCANNDVGMLLDQMGVYVRTGHHCCMPLMEKLGVDGTVRASFGLYTDTQDIDSLCNALEKCNKMLK